MSNDDISLLKNKVVKSMYLPILVILLLKLIYNEWDDIITIGAFILVHHYMSQQFSVIAYKPVNREIFLGLLWIVVTLTSSIVVLYYRGLPDKLYLSLVMLYTNIPEHSMWNLMWVVITTDFALKFICLILKCVVAMVPSFYSDATLKYKAFFWVEQGIQTYRMLVPFVPLISFLTSIQSQYDRYWFNAVSVILYVLLQGTAIYLKLSNTRKKLNMDFNLKGYPSYKGAQDLCTICHNLYVDPVVLQCGNIFCRSCLLSSLLRSTLCPLCDTVIIPFTDPRGLHTNAGKVNTR